MSSEGSLRARGSSGGRDFLSCPQTVDMDELKSAVGCAFEKIEREHPVRKGSSGLVSRRVTRERQRHVLQEPFLFSSCFWGCQRRPRANHSFCFGCHQDAGLVKVDAAGKKISLYVSE